jgi:hypothetical protein
VSAPELLHDVAAYYSGRLEQYGPTPRGVDWNSAESQIVRFEQLTRICPPGQVRHIGDFGCGYAALFDFLCDHGYQVTYSGFDIAAPMIDAARCRWAHNGTCRFSQDESILDGADYVVASGVFNVKLQAPPDAWHSHVVATIDQIARLARRGFAFNALTSYSDPERMRPDLYYGDPCLFFDLCKRRYSRHVALLHDYGLYEFTVHVRY